MIGKNLNKSITNILNTMNDKNFDHILVGTGQATGTLLGKLIKTGESICVIESNKVGGTCLNSGCTPTKTLVASAKQYYQAQRGEFYGFRTQNLKLDFDVVRARMNKIRGGGNQGMQAWLENTPNVKLIFGEGKFVADKVIEVNGEEYHGKNIYINVGTRPFIPKIKGIDEINWLDNAKILDLERIPNRLLIVGSGYIAIEFAQIFSRFGSKVSIVSRGKQILSNEDEDIANEIASFLTEEGIDIFLNAGIREIKKEQDETILELEMGNDVHYLKGDEILIATGRIPNSDKLEVKNSSIEVNDRGYIMVNDYCETAVEGVYALGDVNGQGGFTHTSVNDAEIVLDRIYGGTRKLSDRNKIYGLFTDPPLGRVGLSEKEALAMGKQVLKATRPMSRISRAKEMGETKGFAKLLVDKETDLILGATILGVNGDEIINMFAAIMHSKIPCEHYRKVVLVHPTVSELMPWILDDIREVKTKSN